MNYLIVIPARLKSTRLPNKPLIKILGKEVLLRTYERCLAVVKDSKKIIIATDHESIISFCKEHKMNAIMTSGLCLTGTDRVSKKKKKIHADLYINVQGDEPILDLNDLEKFIDIACQNPKIVYNGYAEIKDKNNYFSPNIPKVIFHTKTKNLIYMSRAAIPANKKFSFEKAWKQVCIYAFPKESLLAFSKNGKTPLEAIEDIEVLRFLELGYRVQMIPLSGNGISIDVPEDIKKVEGYLNEN